MTSATRPAKKLTLVEDQTVRALLAGGSMRAAADSLGIPEATVRSRLSNARKRLLLPTTGHLLYWLDRAE